MRLDGPRMASPGGLLAFPICLAWGAHALQADLRTSAARIASDGVHSYQQVQVRIQFECLDESGLGLIGSDKVNDPVAVAAQLADGGLHH